MTADEIAALLAAARKMQLATINRDGTPHLVTMFYALRDGRIAFWTYRASQKARNLARDPRLTCLVEDGEDYFELRGVQVNGVARPHRRPGRGGRGRPAGRRRAGRRAGRRARRLRGAGRAQAGRLRGRAGAGGQLGPPEAVTAWILTTVERSRPAAAGVLSLLADRLTVGQVGVPGRAQQGSVVRVSRPYEVGRVVRRRGLR